MERDRNVLPRARDHRRPGPGVLRSSTTWRALPRAAVAVLLLAAVAGVTAPARAEVVQPFEVRFSTNTTGAIELIGNTTVTCRSNVTGCSAAQGTATSGRINNNDFSMTHVDVDADPTTFSSSSADLSLPPGSEVLWAGLLWSGQRGSGNCSISGSAVPCGPAPTSTVAAARSVKVKAPGAAAYTTVEAQLFAEDGKYYSSTAIVTPLVTGGANGTWTIADVQTGTGGDIHGGWGLVVVYRNVNLPMRNLTVASGLASVTSSDPRVSFDVSGFRTPPTGAVRTRLGAITFEGDRGLTGDFFEVRSTRVSDPLRPSGNYFRSGVTRFGSAVTNRAPAFDNLLGHDVVAADVGAALGNDARSARVTFGTGGETYLPAVLTFQTDVYAPKVDVVKSAVDLNGPPLRPGDTLRYTMTATNAGDEPSTATVLTDPLPTGVTPVAGTLRAGGADLTDAVDTDAGEVVGSTVTVRLGTGATATGGGQLGVGERRTVQVDATVDGDVADGTVLRNVATVDSASFDGATSYTTSSGAASSVVSNPQADLRIDKEADPTTAVPGGTATYRIDVANDGPQTADGPITVTDTLPAGTTLVSAEGTGWSCAATGADLRCTRRTALPVGAADPITVVVAVPADASAAPANTAEVSGPTSDPVPGNNSDTATPTLAPDADLGVTIDHDGDVVPGEPLTFTVSSVANGPSDAADAAVVVDLPIGYAPASATGTGWTCTTPTALQVRCTRTGPIAPGTLLPPIRVDVDVDPQAGDGTATATIGPAILPGTPDSDATNDSDEDPLTVTRSVDLALDKAHVGTGPFTPGSPPTYELRAAVLGPGALPAGTLVRVTDTLPAGLAFDPAVDTSPWTCGAVSGTVTCDHTLAAPVDPGLPLPLLTLGTTVPSSVSGTAVNTATVSLPDLPGVDPVASNDSASDTLDIDRRADLAVTVTADGSTVDAGDPASTSTLSWSVFNAGPSDDPGPITVAGELDDGLEFATGPSGTGWSCTTSGRSYSCELAAGLVDAATDTALSATVRAPVGTPVSRQAVTARVSSPTPDTVPANDADATTVPVAVATDVAALIDLIGPAVAGGTVTVEVGAANNGPNPAEDPTVVVPLPDGTELVTVTPGAACDAVGRTVVCRWDGPLAVGDTVPEVVLTLLLRPDLTGTLAVSTTASTSTVDTDASNDTATDSEPVTAEVDLAVTVFTAFAYQPGGTATATVLVGNAGPSAARPTFSLNVPNATAFVAAGGAGWTCGSVNGLLSCTADEPLGPGAIAPELSWTVLTEPDATDTKVFIATVSTGPGGATDTDPTNDIDDAPVSPALQAALGVVKSLDTALVAGQAATWTITAANGGPNAIPSGIEVVDDLPATVTPTAAAGTGWTCTVTGQQVRCTTAAALAAGGSLPPIAVTGTLAADATGTVTNTATGGTSNPAVVNPDTSVSTSSVTGEVVAPEQPTPPTTAPPTTAPPAPTGSTTTVPEGGSPVAAPTAPAAPSRLAFTGSSVLLAVLVGAGLLGTGGAAVLADRRRRLTRPA